MLLHRHSLLTTINTTLFYLPDLLICTRSHRPLFYPLYDLRPLISKPIQPPRPISNPSRDQQTQHSRLFTASGAHHARRTEAYQVPSPWFTRISMCTTTSTRGEKQTHPWANFPPRQTSWSDLKYLSPVHHVPATAIRDVLSLRPHLSPLSSWPLCRSSSSLIGRLHMTDCLQIPHCSCLDRAFLSSSKERQEASR